MKISVNKKFKFDRKPNIFYKTVFLQHTATYICVFFFFFFFFFYIQC